MNNPLDQQVLDYLLTIEGSTAWAMCGQFGGEPDPVKKALQRLKRKGLVECRRTTAYWQAVKS